jgi:hypothetical protein
LFDDIGLCDDASQESFRTAHNYEVSPRAQKPCRLDQRRIIRDRYEL